MNSLSTGRIALLLDKLHAEADAADCELMAAVMAQLEASGETPQQFASRLGADQGANYRTT